MKNARSLAAISFYHLGFYLENVGVTCEFWNHIVANQNCQFLFIHDKQDWTISVFLNETKVTNITLESLDILSQQNVLHGHWWSQIQNKHKNDLKKLSKKICLGTTEVIWSY